AGFWQTFCSLVVTPRLARNLNIIQLDTAMAPAPPTSTCPTCRLPCHTCCSSKKMNVVCDNCQKTETPETLPSETITPAVLTSATKSTQESDKLARRKPSSLFGKSQVSLTSASADESSAQDTLNAQKTRAKDASFGDTSFLGISNILIPVIMMELFFQRFDMLQDQFDGLRTLVSRSSVPRGISSALAEGGDTVGTEELNTRISALETQLAYNISASNRSLDANKLLLEENSIHRDELQQTQQLLGKLHRARQDYDTDSMPVSDSGQMLASGPCIIIDREATEVAGGRKYSSPRLAPTSGGAGSERGSAEGCEVIINGLIHDVDNFDEKISDVSAFALLGAVLPALKRSAIASTRVLRMRRPDRAQRGTTAIKSATPRGVLPSLVVKLASPGLVRETHGAGVKGREIK
ncbi:hypothetical protein TSAR_002741, partial [Trichomalopsis sarcophagae]